jgi:diguanylate cyclase (GGDEF)-like protein
VLAHRVDGQEHWLRLRAAACSGPRLLVVDDTTAQRRARLVLSHEASFEPLTGLPNRATLTRRLEEAVRPGAARTGGGLLFVDLDHFKQVNDTLGHEVGDQVLRTVAARLRRAARVNDLVARLGGDEFVLLAEDVVDGDEAASLADRVRHAVEQPVWVEGRPVHVGVSVGTVLLDDCQDAAAALRVADTVMQQAKRARRGREAPTPASSARDPLRHTVSFYDDDELVVAEVADLVGGALLAGRSSVVIATPDHRSRVVALLEARGVDVSGAARDGRYLALDAQQTLDSLLVDGVPDAELFARVVGRTVRQMVDRDGGLDAYGEMVSLLWQQGDVAGALALEDLWNGLQSDLPFWLHCAYAVADALAPPDAHGLLGVCVRHSHVV